MSAKIQHLEGSERQKSRAYSPAVITEGGRIVWLAGQTTTTDLDGKDISGRFEEQARTVFQLINRTLERAGGSLANLVTMTVFITDIRYGDEFVRLRGEILRRDFPASALIGVSHLANPDALLEIQAIAALE